ncbi:MAG: undecaprenyl/decaprenyl-phosphate alpha-N-acetylglucosaminyl 1-phosphate transferase [Patescibacteria group bacterium]|nr:MAG: undecaprenyl/decaprenyl-phosphate alpha-N-acetylglucosaminyl 1-phosphate transferase [Patescibacteria group bacterium]
MLAFICTFLAAALLSPIVITIYKRHGWVDDPKTSKHAKKTHTTVVPRGGGLVIFLSICIGVLLFLQFDKHLIAIMTGALILTIAGVADDIYDIHPIIRLGTGLLATLIVVGSGIGIAYVSNPFGAGVIHLNQPQIVFSFLGEQHTIWVLADIFAVLFIMWNMNIVNWSKGVDGQMPGFVSIALIFVGILSTRFIDDPTVFNTAILSFIAAGAFAGLLIWNWYPQKILPGYGAGSLAGYFLAVLAILSGAKVATVLMVLGIPTADALFTILRRIKAGKSPLWGDRGHLHHKLLDVLKWGRRKIAIFYWSTSFLLGLSSLYLNTTGKLITMGVVFVLVFSFLIWAKIQTKKVTNANKI